MIKRIYKILSIIFIVICGTAFNSSARTLIIDLFDDESYVNSLGGNNNTWINNPGDKTIDCEADLLKERRGYYLKLAYDIDSALTYLATGVYIPEYSDNSLVGYAKEGMPHVGSGGFYFLIDNTDITKYNYLVFHARGDEKAGYTRRFKIELKTKDQSSSYIVDGVTNKWKKFIVPLYAFEKITDWTKITEMTIVLNEAVTDKTGVLYFDDFYFAFHASETPRMTRRNNKAEHESAYEQKFIMGGEVNMNYRSIPERKGEFFHSESLTFEGTSGRLSARMKANFDTQEFGETAYMESIDESPYYQFRKSTPTIKLEDVQLNIERITPLLNNVTIGNIWVGYSPYIISPYWGWKGIAASGRRGDFEHATFMIKRQFDSVGVGNRSLYYFGNHRLKYVGMYDYKTAKLDEGSQAIGTQKETGNWDVRPVSYEYSYLASALFRFLNHRVNYEFIFGEYNYKQVASADYSSPKYPTYSHEVSSSSVNDRMYKVQMFFDGISRGTKLYLTYRDVGPDFTPEYRQEPIIFEDALADQKGYCINLKQYYNNYYVSLFFDDIKRKTNSDYYRRTFNYGAGYIGSRDLELSINKEIKSDKYINTSLAIDKNEKVESLMLAFQYSVIYPLTPGVRYPLTPKVTFREDKIHNRKTGDKYTQHSLQVDLNFRLETDFGFSVGYKTTRYGDPSWESTDSPYTDNYLNAYLNMRF
jgi:hypothetical protein